MYIYLDVMKDFSCRMCGACCRNDWQVTVDENSFRRNAEWFAGRGAAEEFSRAFIPLAGGKSLGEYACIAKQESGGCWFLTAGNLCRLHAEAGHAQLDNVCQTYPRYPMATARGMELTLSFSCPAVLDLVSRAAPLGFVRSDCAPVDINPGCEVVAVFPAQQTDYNPLRHYFELEHHFIDILQWRACPLAERLRLLDSTVGRLCSPDGADNLGDRLNEIIYGNYEFMDRHGGTAEQKEFTAEILLEHFLVNLVFKKPFYILGLQRAAALFGGLWREIEATCCRQAAGLAETRQTVMALELQYSHNRQELWKRI